MAPIGGGTDRTGWSRSVPWALAGQCEMKAEGSLVAIVPVVAITCAALQVTLTPWVGMDYLILDAAALPTDMAMAAMA